MLKIYNSDFSKRDVNAINKMQKITLPSDVPCDIIRDSDCWVIAKYNNQFAGFGGIRFLYDDIWYLCRAGVLQKFHGRGIQKALIYARIDAAAEYGASVIITDCTMDNYGSANSLISCGFKLYKPGYNWALDNSIYWKKEL